MGGIRAFDDEGGLVTSFAQHDDEPRDTSIATSIGKAVISHAEEASIKSGESHQDKLETLSQREQEVIAYVSFGWTNNEIAGALHLSPETIKSHIRKIIGKTGALSRAHMVRIGFGLEILSPEDSLEELVRTTEERNRGWRQ